jgi:hypothetical protein
LHPYFSDAYKAKSEAQTPCTRVENLIVAQLLQKFPAFYETLRFMMTFTRAATGLYPEAV